MESEIVNPVQLVSFVPLAEGADPHFVLSPEDIPNVEELVIEDGKPVDNLFVEKQNHLLAEPLYSSWTSPIREPAGGKRHGSTPSLRHRARPQR